MNETLNGWDMWMHELSKLPMVKPEHISCDSMTIDMTTLSKSRCLLRSPRSEFRDK